MRYERLIREVYYRPLCVMPHAHAAVAAVLEARIQGAPQAGEFDDWVYQPEPYHVEDGIGIVPIQGIMASKVSEIDKSCGMADVGDIGRDLNAATSDKDVQGILLDVDSPGGSVTGIPELADQVASARSKKPVFAFSDGLMASAAYWVSSGADAIYASSGADVGSIGVYLPILDQSVAYAAKGLQMNVIKAGKYKGAGLPGTPLTDEQRAEFQAGVDYVYGQFKGHVNAYRPKVKDAAMQGQTFMGHQARDARLVDSITTRAKAMSDLRRFANRKP